LALIESFYFSFYISTFLADPLTLPLESLGELRVQAAGSAQGTDKTKLFQA